MFPVEYWLHSGEFLASQSQLLMVTLTILKVMTLVQLVILMDTSFNMINLLPPEIGQLNNLEQFVLLVNQY
ncbi:hypothetical protein BY996DRAFT_6530232 [Phakopsora pachyrhizi]|nr:hypothetical protein BY996DRAFT_6446227 [Phakopsora pachyrhizi]KAI8460956.1 hypothetical protein BY996DRAFT_6530232 [Phakopsora pachyrhizi]